MVSKRRIVEFFTVISVLIVLKLVVFDAVIKVKFYHQKTVDYCYTNPTSGEKGRTFDRTWKDIKILDTFRKGFIVNFTDIKSFDQDKLLFVTGADYSHFNESRAAIESVQRIFPRNPVIYYDLGLTQTQRKEVQQFGGVQYKVFDFSSYPPHLSRLKTYAFKPVIIMTELLAHQGLFWFDSSIRFFTDIKAGIEKAVENRGIVLFSRTSHSTYSVTAPGMYDYLPSDVELLKRSEQYQAGCMLMFLTDWMFERVYLPFTLCALQRECIAPISQLNCQGLRQWDKFGGCHRFDQTLINILLINAYNSTLDSKVANKFFNVNKTLAKASLIDWLCYWLYICFI